MSSEYPKVSIEFCNKCKWGLRSFWYLQELFQTFEENIKELSVKPNNTHPGTFRVVGYIDSASSEVVIWDRKIDGGFPDAKTLKKRIKNLIFHETDDVSIGKHNERTNIGDNNKSGQDKNNDDVTAGRLRSVGQSKSSCPIDAKTDCTECQ